ncbi:hypothetical protein [Streptomyces decoyicus]
MATTDRRELVNHGQQRHEAVGGAVGPGTYSLLCHGHQLSICPSQDRTAGTQSVECVVHIAQDRSLWGPRREHLALRVPSSQSVEGRVQIPSRCPTLVTAHQAILSPAATSAGGNYGGEAAPVVVKLGVSVSNTKTRRLL